MRDYEKWERIIVTVLAIAAGYALCWVISLVYDIWLDVLHKLLLALP